MRLVKRFLPLVGFLAAFGATPAQATLEITGFENDPGSKFVGINIDSLGYRTGGTAGRFRLDVRDTVTFAPSTLYAFCIDVLTNLISYTPYSVSTSIPGFADPDKRAQLAAIMFNSNAVLNAALTQEDKDASSAALQVAIWEILYETGLSGYSVENGNFWVYGDFEPYIGLTNSYLANVESGLWTGDPSTLRALVSDTGNSQNLVFQTAPVPEPATWALMLLGFGAIGSALRRRHVQAALPA
jgi:PEP-CTERM motif